MRGTIGRRLPYCSSNFAGNVTARQTLNCFSTSSSGDGGGGGGGGGGGRGRGRGGPTRFEFNVPGDELKSAFDFTVPAPGQRLPDDGPLSHGLGHGRGTPLPSSPVLPSFSSFVAAVGRGRGRGSPSPQDSDSKKPIFFKKDDSPPQGPATSADAGESKPPSSEAEARNPIFPYGFFSALSGAGRGKPFQQPEPERPVEENRHLRAKPLSPHPDVVRRNAVRRTVGVLSGDGPDGSISAGRGDERGRGRGLQGRGRGRGTFGRGGRGGAFRERGDRNFDRNSKDDEDDDQVEGLVLGNDADGEKFAERMGAEKMNMIAEAFEEICDRVLPSPAMDAHLDGFHTNCLIEFEPEYLMEFDTNPDIDEKPPIPLRDALEKMKPFLMVYEGIQSQEEWEEVIKATMEQVPLMKEIVDYYSGPDRVTAKQQQQELERVAKTLPQTAPASVKRFASRAVLSLQSNPGWGFDKKCQFMDKLVMEVSQQYK